jgi:FlaG/FlaF family flagellin (archaellin)
MKTALFAAVAIALAAPVAASTFDLGDTALTPAQTAQIASVLDSDDNTNAMQRRIDVILGKVSLNTSPALAKAAEVQFIKNSDLSSNDMMRLINAVDRPGTASADAVTNAQVMFILNSDLSSNDKERRIEAIQN